MPKPSFEMFVFTIEGKTTRVVNEKQVKAHLKDIADPNASPDKAWNEGFVSGLDAAGVLSSVQYDDLMAFVAEM